MGSSWGWVSRGRARQVGTLPSMSDEPNYGESAPRVRRSTATSAFGASKREGHDASAFYARFGTPDISADDTLADPVLVDPVRNQIFVGDSRDMSRIPNNSVGLVVTSPPYFAGKAYEEALGEGHIPADYVEYLEMLTEVFAECQRVLEPGGRIVVNVANLGRRPFRSLASDITTILQDELGFLLRGEVVWLKQRGSSGSCAWGSFRSPTNPVLRDTTERLIMASKGRFDRAIVPAKRAKRGLPSVSTSTSDEFIEATIDVWEIQPESATRVNHPAPFPVTLAERCIDLYSFKGDLILDPFMGSGSTAVAASRLSRSFVGFDTDENYVARAMQRVADDGKPRTNEETRSIRDVVEEILTLNRFHKIVWGQKILTGFEIAGKAIRPDGRTILFDIAGGLTNVRPGLSRGDLLWRAIGRAAVVTEVFPGERLVVFTSGLPEKLSGGNALAAVVGPGMPITAVIDVSDFESARHHSALGD